jgi:hypothetical protein
LQPMCLTCIIDTLPTFMLNSSLPKIILSFELMKSCLARFPFDLNGEIHSILPLHVIDFSSRYQPWTLLWDCLCNAEPRPEACSGGVVTGLTLAGCLTLAISPSLYKPEVNKVSLPSG